MPYHLPRRVLPRSLPTVWGGHTHVRVFSASVPRCAIVGALMRSPRTGGPCSRLIFMADMVQKGVEEVKLLTVLYHGPGWDPLTK